MEQVKQIHQCAHIVDAHFDLLMDVEIQRGYGRKKVIETDYLPKFREGGVNTVVAAIYIDNQFVPEMSLRKALNQIQALYAEMDESPEVISLCRSVADIQKAEEEGKIGFILSLEGAEPLYRDVNLLRIFYELGLRKLGFVWSRRNDAGDGSDFILGRKRKQGGLSDFGFELIEKAEELGIVLDVTHLNDEGFWDVMEAARHPVIASHSNCRSICPSPRNLSDDQIKAIAEKGGVIGINAVSFVVADTDEQANVDGLLAHMDHIKRLVGIEHMGLGLDLCEDFMKYIAPETLAQIPRKPFDVIKGHGEIPKITEALLKHGYKESDIEQILGGNWLRVYREVWK
ncbi:dipeptidase [Thermoflavimicrobium dichotomicum]|uniref:Membrane dipeptidase n=1 Tax=Thermoflavimicrobium dichotomicum TaxID=46223 RepID=A0A1I3PYL5_9BACL|nr:dipeptidase [Thermoflavimicrobium dichotomicum]SFJ26291.1 membrane dipeptidase [Thermoflavimicrobium dichotomicum]